MSLQTRLTAVYLLLLVPALVILSVALYLIYRDKVYGAVDDSLATRAEAIEAALEHLIGPITESDVDLSRSGLDRQALQGAVFQLRQPDGSVIYSSLGPGRQLQRPSNDALTDGYSTADIAGDRSRILVQPVVRLGETTTEIEVHAPLDAADRSLSDIRYVLVAGTLLIILGTSVPAYVVAGRATEPVRRVSRLAVEIEKTADFTRRLPLTGTAGEMRELTATFNAMIDRVDQMIQGQRAFLADSSHELRRPLTILRTNIDVINDPRLSDAERRAIEEEMRLEAEAMTRLVSDLLLLAREGQSTFRFETVELSSVAERAFEAARLGCRNHIFMKDIEPGVWLEADPDRLIQAVANLLHNACAYTPGQGRISLRLHSVANGVVLEVSDTGVGMSEQDIFHAFDRFYRGEGAHATKAEGFGLGLAIVKFIIEAHSGSIAVKSKLGSGTTFTVSLPSASHLPERPSRRPSPIST